MPTFFGLGVLWPAGASWADAVEAFVGPLDEHPALERLEGNRVTHLLERQRLALACEAAAVRIAALEDELRRLLDSRAVAVAERLSSVRGSDAVSRARIGALLGGERAD